MRFSRILYGNTDLGGGTGWRVIASSPGIAPDVMDQIPSLCNRLLEKVRKQSGDRHFFWERRGLVGNDLFVSMQRKAKDAYGRPNAGLVLVAFPEEETVPLKSLPSAFLCLFGGDADWESASAAGGIIQPVDIAQKTLKASLDNLEIGNGDLLEMGWVASLGSFLNSPKAAATKSLLFPADEPVKGIDVVGIAQTDGRLAFGGQAGSRSTVYRTVRPAFVIFVLLALVIAIGNLKIALTESRGELVKMEGERQQLRDQLGKLREEKSQKIEKIKGMKLQIDNIRSENIKLQRENKELRQFRKTSLKEQEDAVKNEIRRLEEENADLKDIADRHDLLVDEIFRIAKEYSPMTSTDYRRLFDRLDIKHEWQGDQKTGSAENLQYKQHALLLRFMATSGEDRAYFYANSAKYHEFVANSQLWEFVKGNKKNDERNENYDTIRPKIGREREAMRALIEHAAGPKQRITPGNLEP